MSTFLCDIFQESADTHTQLNINLPLNIADTLVEDTVISECMDLASHYYGTA